MKIQNVKGCFDYLPEEASIRNYINDVLRDTFEKYDYMPIETPIICYLDMLTDKYEEGNDILKEIYTLTDQGNRSLGLRYDLTVPFAKFIALSKNKIKLPFKRYEIAKAFRDGPVKLGRDREFTQCDVDVVGISGQMIEAECLNLYVDAFKKLNIDIKIKYNNRNLMKGLMIESGIDDDLIKKTITIVDKMDKLSHKEFISQLENLGLSKSNIDNLLNLFNLDLSDLTTKFLDTNINEIKIGLDEVNNLDKFIKILGIDKYCVFTSTLARGQDYYTGNVFEVYEKTGKISSSIGGGGRYDKMITDFIDDGLEYPAVGISFGLSSIYEILSLNNENVNNMKSLLYIIPMSEEDEGVSLRLACFLRRYDIRVTVEMNRRKVKKCFEWADKNNIPYVVVIGENERKNGYINIKNMNTKREVNVKIDDYDEIIRILNSNN